MNIGSRSRRCSLSKAAELLVWVGVWPLCFAAQVALAGGADKVRTVIFLDPDANDGRPGSVLADRGIRSTFAAARGQKVEVHSEHLDLPRFADAAYQDELAEFLRRKYADRKVDVIIAGLASGLDFVLKYRQRAFPGVPIVYCAVDHREVSARKLPADVIGAPIQMDLAGTLDVALRLHPATQRVYVITGKAEFDVQWHAEARQSFQPYEDKLEFIYLAGLPMPDLLKQVAELPENSIVYYVHIFQDGAGAIMVPAEALKMVADHANVPIYSHVDTYVGRGIVGGRVFSFEATGQNAAAISLRILAGETPQRIGMQPIAQNGYLFDARQLKRWDISPAALPHGSEVRHHELTFWDLYRWHILGVFSLVVVQTLLIIGLLVQRASRWRAENRFQQAVKAAPNGMLIIGPDGKIALVNDAMERLFDYSKAEMLGQLAEMLLPERLRSAHPERCNGVLSAPQAGAPKAGRELFGQRKDGSEVPIEIGLSPLRTEAGASVLASIIDVSERKRAEIELRELTGRLLLAQETERRRIARELHDDLNQSLAILAVELDLLRQKPPETAAHADERLQQLSAQVKQLSSSVHELSHQLHPAKLEQLGLVPAVVGLSKDLSESHGLPITVKHHDVPDMIVDETALCLYRIVQESLQNVVKHSAARHATVELNCDVHSISLRIMDDGKGFDAKSLDGKEGLGLVSMRERLRLVQGEIAIHSQPGEGTRIEVRVPLHAPETGRITLKSAATSVGCG